MHLERRDVLARCATGLGLGPEGVAPEVFVKEPLESVLRDRGDALEHEWRLGGPDQDPAVLRTIAAHANALEAGTEELDVAGTEVVEPVHVGDLALVVRGRKTIEHQVVLVIHRAERRSAIEGAGGLGEAAKETGDLLLVLRATQ